MKINKRKNSLQAYPEFPKDIILFSKLFFMKENFLKEY